MGKQLQLAICLIWLGIMPQAAWAESSQPFSSEQHRFKLRVVAGPLEHPWSIAFLPDGRKLVTERPGRLRLINADGRLDPQPITGLPPIAAVGQGGLLDVVLHPDYPRNGWIYLSYAGKNDDGQGTDVLRARLQGKQLTDVQVIFRMLPKTGTGHHFGSRLVFDREGFLYITLGDRGDKERAQRLDDHAGSVIRLHDDGRVPIDNPFRSNPGAKPEKWTLGNRNMQGAALHPVTGELWTHEHGPQGGDEINIMRAGRNYGWPVITYGRNYVIGTRIGEGTEKPGMVQPIHHWTPSIAPSGMSFYTGRQFPRWQGNLFVGALKDQMLVRLELDGERIKRQEILLKNAVGRIRDVRTGPDGYLYLLTDSPDGQLLRVEPVP
ncbi:MAG: PQQ-dependent sugar dehydrogenase [Rhodocyclaceae bacterium]|nr:PQQ-dependent sugar dehydrogenase [Rhodocyclaceae bacterium]MDZ4214228.1 PQQ-dependent sugar dehydrogenase [Rhodocyclaceae bacterium]